MLKIVRSGQNIEVSSINDDRSYSIPIKDVAKLVKYELDMLHYAVETREDPKRSRKQPHLGSALTDSALLHARNLYQFLAGSPIKDDIVAGHIISKSDGSPWKFNKLSYVKSQLDESQKYRHHLAYSRVTLGRTYWPLKRIRAHIDAAYKEFVGLLSEAEQEWWQI